jgi:hypothetical protein
MKALLLIMAMITLISMSSSFASIGDTDVVFCDDIRTEANKFCNEEVDKSQKISCYQSQVDRLVMMSNTSEELYDGEEVCAY